MIFTVSSIFFDNAHLLDPELGAVVTSLRLAHGRIASWGKRAVRGDLCLDLQGALVLPGLINAHDHLELNNFPRLKYRGAYRNARVWSNEVAARLDTDPRIVAARQVPLADRLYIGGLKNLLSGATTVCHHNPLHRPLRSDFPVKVVHRYGWAHSFYREADVASSYRRTPRTRPWIIHLAEGTDAEAARELARLDAVGALGGNTVLVHGVGLTEADIQRTLEAGAALVWCPSSNFFLLHATAQVNSFARARRLALGSDSRLSGERDLLNELACARGAAQITLPELLNAVTGDAAAIMRLKDVGTLQPGAHADMVILAAPNGDPYDEIGKARRRDIRAILINGKVRIADPDFRALLPNAERVLLDGREKVLARKVAVGYARNSISEPGLELDAHQG